MNKEIEMLAASAERNETTRFQIAYFLIGQEPTDQAKMHKCINEMSARLKSIEAAKEEIAQMIDMSELQTLEIVNLGDTLTDEIKKRMLIRKVNSYRAQSDRLFAKIESWESEITHLHEIYKVIEGRTALKPWGSFEVQMEYWNQKLADELRMKNLLGQPVNSETVKAILALPETSQVRAELVAGMKAISDRRDK